MLAITFLAPGWLWLALIVPLLWFLPRRLHDPVQGALRSLLLLFVIAAAADPVDLDASDAAWQVVILDAHGSVGARESARAGALAEGLGRTVHGGGPRVLVLAGATAAPESLRDAYDRVLVARDVRSSSPLSAALATAARAIPRGSRAWISLFSDGLATDRRWGPVVQDLQARGIPVHVYELDAEATWTDEVRIVRVRAPRVVRVGHEARLEVEFDGPGVETSEIELRDAHGTVLARAKLSGADQGCGLSCSERISIAYEPYEAGIHDLVVISKRIRDGVVSSQRRIRVAVQPPLRVLYVGERMKEGGPRLGDLVGPGFELVTPEGPLMNALVRSDLVVIDDTPSEKISKRDQEAILKLVEQGRIGLVMTGGRASFGAGGWHRQPLADALPIEMVQKEEKRDPSTALAIVIDTSGSMGGNRVQLAKEVARLAIRRLLPHDKVGIVEFYGAKRWAAPLQPASNAIEIQRALNRLNAGGGTVIMPAIEEAFYGLQNVRTRYKHVLVLTDGGVEQGAFEPLLRRMANKGITVSTVLVGPGMHSEFLVNLANWGKGRFYGVPNRFNLPEVILKQPASAHLPAWRPGSHVVASRGAAGWWEGVDRTAIPPLSGYVEARARPGADVLLEVESTKHPILATWRHGLGRVTTLMTEPTGPGTSSWRDWKDMGTWLGRVLARTASESRIAMRPTARRDGDEVLLTSHADAARAQPKAQVRAKPAAPWTDLPLRVRAPGLYEARLPASEVDALRVLDFVNSPWLVVPSDDVHPELNVPWEDALDLEALAATTGGERLDVEFKAIYPPEASRGGSFLVVEVFWPWCLLAALLLFLAEIAWRRRPRGDVR